MYSEMRERKFQNDLPNNLPKRIQNDASFKNLVRFTFPVEFLTKFKEGQPSWFSDLKLEGELELAQSLSPNTVGMNRGKIFESAHLRPFLKYDRKNFERLQMKFASTLGFSFDATALDPAMKQTASTEKVGKAYLGWLVQQTAYWNDVTHLIEEFQSELRGTPITIVQGDVDLGHAKVANGGIEIAMQAASDAERRLVDSLQEICSRWRISHFNAAECPILKTPKTSGLLDTANTEGVHTPQLPDIYPIEGSGQHVDQMNSRRDSSLQGHLADWAKITSKDSKNSRPYDSLARQYQLQHLWRLLESRNPGCLQRKLRPLNSIFVAYFDVALPTIKRDLANLRNAPSKILEISLETRF